MKFGYHKSIGGTDDYHFGKVDGVDRKFSRIVVGTAIPMLDRVKGAYVVLAENYQMTGAANWLALAGQAANWNQLEAALAQLRQDVKFSHIIVEKDEFLPFVRKMKGLQWGLNEIPRQIYAAEAHASTEIGRSYTDELLAENRITGLGKGSQVRRDLELEPQMGVLALSVACCWMREHPVVYINQGNYNPREKRRIVGMEGLL